MRNTNKGSKKLPDKVKDLLEGAELHTLKGWFRFHVMDHCPRCDKELLEVGYLNIIYGQRYKCSNRDCGWGW